MLLTIAAEDLLCEAVARRLVSDYVPTATVREPALGLAGEDDLLRRIASCNSIARFIGPTLVLTDLDKPENCPPAMVARWLDGIRADTRLLLRFAVLEVEAWILADRAGVADWLGVSEANIPRAPEQESDPKRVLVQIASRSRRRSIKEAMVPRTGLGTSRTGPDYNAEVGRFVAGAWNPEAARPRAPNLDRAILRLQALR